MKGTVTANISKITNTPMNINKVGGLPVVVLGTGVGVGVGGTGVGVGTGVAVGTGCVGVVWANTTAELNIKNAVRVRAVPKISPITTRRILLFPSIFTV